MRSRLAGAAVGAVFGAVLCWSGMSSPVIIRQALLFERSYLFLMFASAVFTAAVGLRILARFRDRAVLHDAPTTWRPEPVGRDHILGSLIFGAGWGLADACPAPIVTQIGQGTPWAIFTFAGVAVGIYAYLRRGAPETEPATDASARRWARTASPASSVS